MKRALARPPHRPTYGEGRYCALTIGFDVERRRAPDLDWRGQKGAVANLTTHRGRAARYERCAALACEPCLNRDDHLNAAGLEGARVLVTDAVVSDE